MNLTLFAQQYRQNVQIETESSNTASEKVTAPKNTFTSSSTESSWK